MKINTLSELEKLGISSSAQKYLFDCTLRTVQKFKSSSDESEMNNIIYKKAELILSSMKAANERVVLYPLLSADPHLLLCLSGLLSLGAQFGRSETSPQAQDTPSAPLDEETREKKQSVLGSGLRDVLDVLSSEFGTTEEEALSASAGLIARFDRLAAESPSSNPWTEMAALKGNIFSRMKAMESICKAHYAEILKDVRMPVYASLCDVLRGPAGRKLYQVLRRLHENDAEHKHR